MTLQFGIRIVAWALLIALIVVTIGPIDVRPVTPLPTQVERALALAIVGFAFALAYPRHLVMISIVVLGATILLEVLQLITPSRHGRVVDAAVKLVGGSFGIACGHALNRIRHRG